MRFGLFIPQGWRLDLVGIEPGDQWRVMSDLATHVDEGGVWDSLWVYDHFHTVPMPTDEATHEAWSLMAAFAATTSRVKLGQMCTAMSVVLDGLLTVPQISVCWLQGPAIGGGAELVLRVSGPR